ncbi:MAG TPA: hypothetical protein VNQ79_18635 [Blastocatellia bacterium]|nr:hypothetical protein [Blastocatellia bacterium]
MIEALLEELSRCHARRRELETLHARALRLRTGSERLARHIVARIEADIRDRESLAGSHQGSALSAMREKRAAWRRIVREVIEEAVNESEATHSLQTTESE